MCDYCELFKLRYQQLRHKTPKEVCEMQKKTSERVRRSEHEGNKKKRKWKSRKENTQGILNQIGSTNYNLDYV